MKLVYKTSQVAVFDDVLSETEMFLIRAVMLSQEMKPHIFTGYQNYAMSADDRPAFKSATTHAIIPDPEPVAAEVDAFYKQLDLAVKEANITLPTKICASQFWVYPHGSALKYHDDHIYGGTYAFYIHEEWNQEWGGELMLRDDGDIGGEFILPKPNRLVLIAPGVFHSVAPVHPRSGDRHRQSITGFMYLKDHFKD